LSSVLRPRQHSMGHGTYSLVHSTHLIVHNVIKNMACTIRPNSNSTGLRLW